MAEIMADGFDVPAGPAAARPAARLSIGQKTFYAVGDIADGVKNTALGLFLLLYLTGVLGLSGSMAGLASGLAVLVDAVLDPLIGYWSDNLRSRWGRRHPFMLLSVIPFSIAIGLIFSLPHLESPWLTFAMALATLVTLRVGFSCFVLPYAALGAEVARDYTERSVLMTFRNFFNNCGVILVLVLGYSVFLTDKAAFLSRDAYIPFGWTCAAIIFVSVLVSCASSWRLRHLMHEVAPKEAGARSRVFGDFFDIFRNSSFVILFMTVLTFFISQGAAASLTNHALLFFWKLPPEIIQFIPIGLVVGNVVGIPVVGLLLRRYEKSVICAFALAIFCACQAIPASLYLAGLVSDSAVPFMLWGFQFVIGIAATCATITFGSMMMDAADEHELLFSVRREGLYFAGLVFSVKAAVGGGFIVAGVALDLIGFTQGVATSPDAIPQNTLTLLGIVSGPGAAIVSLISVVILLRYRLGKDKLHSIQAELEARRAAPA
ncbi:MAG: MFS transporter [Alphaproteobacteria bacterium]|nr:MFS transporter [Alphaproteobacteria bacterium]